VNLDQNHNAPGLSTVPACHVSLQLIPLSIQREGDSYLVGSLELNRFYQIPEIGVQVIRLLQQGLSLPEVKEKLGAGEVDIDDFASTLIEIGLAYPGPLREPVNTPLIASAKWFRIAGRIGRIIFSLPSACLCMLVVLYAAICLVKVPQAWPSLRVFYFPGHLTASLLILLVLRFFMVLLHELGHMLAAARLNIPSYLGVGTRLWTIVIEADLTGVLSQPRRKRYLPLLAGMLTDVFIMSILLITVVHLLNAHAGPFVVQLLQASIMQTLLVLFWQLNIFLRTDFYYVICTILAYPDMDRDARIYIQTLLHRFSRGHIGTRLESDPIPDRLNVVRLFSLIWLVGRLASIYVLLAVAVPTLLLYARDSWRAFMAASSKALPYDFLFFALLSTVLFVSGIWMWLSRIKSRRLRLSDQQ
jgi:putative peptide zinc metalloprotease protein